MSTFSSLFSLIYFTRPLLLIFFFFFGTPITLLCCWKGSLGSGCLFVFNFFLFSRLKKVLLIFLLFHQFFLSNYCKAYLIINLIYHKFRFWIFHLASLYNLYFDHSFINILLNVETFFHFLDYNSYDYKFKIWLWFKILVYSIITIVILVLLLFFCFSSVWVTFSWCVCVYVCVSNYFGFFVYIFLMIYHRDSWFIYILWGTWSFVHLLVLAGH